MALISVLGGLLLALAFFLREIQLGRERRKDTEVYRQLRRAIAHAQAEIQSLEEDVYVLRHILTERGLFDEREFSQRRNELIEIPRRIAAEREAIRRRLGVAAPHLVVDDRNDNVH